jgi:hypothetical protein
MALHDRIGPAILIALSIYSDCGAAGPRWTPIGGSDLAQMGFVFGIVFFIVEVTDIFSGVCRGPRRKPGTRRSASAATKTTSVRKRNPRR